MLCYIDNDFSSVGRCWKSVDVPIACLELDGQIASAPAPKEWAWELSSVESALSPSCGDDPFCGFNRGFGLAIGPRLFGQKKRWRAWIRRTCRTNPLLASPTFSFGFRRGDFANSGGLKRGNKIIRASDMNSLNLNSNSYGHFGPKIRIKNKVIGAFNTDSLNLNKCGHFRSKIRIIKKFPEFITVDSA